MFRINFIKKPAKQKIGVAEFLQKNLTIGLISAITSLCLFESANSSLPARSNISIVGSSTVYPFIATIAEKFDPQKKFRTPIIESTGTGGGFKLFCGGVGASFPDFANASRQIEPSEIELCKKNGVNNLGEIKIGYDGIIIANSVAGQKFNLTKNQIFMALATHVPKNDRLVENKFRKWSEIDKNLPNIEIKIYGPPSTSGTRDAFVELTMKSVCMNLPEFVSAFPDKKIRQKKCITIRNDGVFVEAGENDNLIVQKLRNDKNALGIFGFSFLEENKNTIQATTIENIAPSVATIVNSKYSISRPLFVYFKKEHFDLTLGMREFIKAIVGKEALGNKGYLMRKGLVPLSDSELSKIRDKTLKSL